MCPVDDHGIEAIRKSAEELVPGDKSNYYIKTGLTGGGEITPSGLNTEGKNTTIDIGDTYAKLPSTPLNDRNALSIHNTSTTDILYIGFDSNVTADNVLGNTSGRQLGTGQVMNFDVTNNVEIYAIAPTGKTIRVHLMELA